MTLLPKLHTFWGVMYLKVHPLACISPMILRKSSICPDVSKPQCGFGFFSLLEITNCAPAWPMSFGTPSMPERTLRAYI
jgi:hypothetical protein